MKSGRAPLTLAPWARTGHPSELASWAVAHRTGPTGWLADPAAWKVQYEYKTAIKAMRRRGFPDGDVLRGWLRVFAAAPDYESQTYLRALLTGRWLDPEQGCLPHDEAAAWLALGNLGPMAFMAGLTATEATERLAADTLNDDGLTALIALRGWVLPPTSVTGGY